MFFKTNPVKIVGHDPKVQIKCIRKKCFFYEIYTKKTETITKHILYNRSAIGRGRLGEDVRNHARLDFEILVVLRHQLVVHVVGHVFRQLKTTDVKRERVPKPLLTSK